MTVSMALLKSCARMRSLPTVSFAILLDSSCIADALLLWSAALINGSGPQSMQTRVTPVRGGRPMYASKTLAQLTAGPCDRDAVPPFHVCSESSIISGLPSPQSRPSGLTEQRQEFRSRHVTPYIC